MQQFSSQWPGGQVGIIANPASGRDIRRLVAQASVFPIAEKRNMITRAFSALGALGIGRVLIMPDKDGIMHRLVRALRAPPPGAQTWPAVDFVDIPLEDSANDTLRATERMVAAGCGALIVMGGDGTNRLVAREAGEVPMVSLSTGTNNVFPAVREATIAGLCAGLIASGRVPREAGCFRAKCLRILVNGTVRDLALVDVCTSEELFVGAKALWRAEGLDQLFVTFAEADAIGLSSIAGLLRPISRRAPGGLLVDLAAPAKAGRRLMAPIAPGVIVEVGIEGVRPIGAGEAVPIRLRRGVVALDGEREIEFDGSDRVEVRLAADGPFSVEIDRVMAYAAQHGLLELHGSKIGASE